MFSIQIRGGLPISEQLENRITELIVSGEMEENEKLPAVREVARELAINPNTVQKTYQKLEFLGLIYSIPGKGSYVAERQGFIDEVKKKAAAEFKAAAEEAMQRGLSGDELKRIIDDTGGGM